MYFLYKSLLCKLGSVLDCSMGWVMPHTSNLEALSQAIKGDAVLSHCFLSCLLGYPLSSIMFISFILCTISRAVMPAANPASYSSFSSLSLFTFWKNYCLSALNSSSTYLTSSNSYLDLLRLESGLRRNTDRPLLSILVREYGYYH